MSSEHHGSTDAHNERARYHYAVKELEDTPEWIWDVLIGLLEYEETHPQLFRAVDEGKFARYPCVEEEVLKHVPVEVLVVARYIQTHPREVDQ